jgi:hypothetical protein
MPTCDTRPPDFVTPPATPTCLNRPPDYHTPNPSTSSLDDIIAEVESGKRGDPAINTLLPPIQPVWPRGMTPPALTQSRQSMSLSLPIIHVPPSSLAHFCQVFGVTNEVHRTWFVEGIRLWPTVTHLNILKYKSPPCAVTGKLIDRLIECGIVRKSRLALFVANTFIIPKADNTARLIVNYSKLTPYLKAPKFYLPSIF